MVHNVQTPYQQQFPSLDHLPVAEWDTNDTYRVSAENVKTINVVNDAAKQGVKLATGFVDTARSDKHFQNILKVVKNDHQRNPNLKVKKYFMKYKH